MASTCPRDWEVLQKINVAKQKSLLTLMTISHPGSAGGSLRSSAFQGGASERG